MTPLITVVVPVYKVEPYLDHCVRSLVGQTYQNLEILLVDDGSPDRCGAMCDAWAEKDPRIRALHKQNGGLSDARNAGTQQAKGAYITYVDSDDWAAPTMVETLCRSLLDNGADAAVGDMLKTTDGQAGVPPAKCPPLVMDGINALETLLYQKYFDTSACGSLYRTATMRQIPYPVGRLFEDLFTTYKVLYGCQKVVYTGQQLYFYRQNPQSIMYRRFDMRSFDAADGADEIVAFVTQNCPALLPAAQSRRFSAYSLVLRRMPPGPLPPELQARQEALWRFIRSYRRAMLLDSRARFKNRAAAAAAYLGKKWFLKL